MLRYDTIPDAILTCSQKLTWASLIYRTEQTTKRSETKSKKKTDMLKSIGKQSGECIESSGRKERLRWEGFAEKEGFKSLEWKSDGWLNTNKYKC